MGNKQRMAFAKENPGFSLCFFHLQMKDIARKDIATEAPMESSTVPSVSLGPAGQADAEVRMKPAQLAPEIDDFP